MRALSSLPPSNHGHTAEPWRSNSHGMKPWSILGPWSNHRGRGGAGSVDGIESDEEEPQERKCLIQT